MTDVLETLNAAGIRCLTFTVNGKVTIQDFAGSSSEGCRRIGSVQQCWGTTTSGLLETFPVSFADSNVRIILTAITTNPRPATVTVITNTNFASRTYESDGDRNDGETLSYIAFGVANDANW